MQISFSASGSVGDVRAALAGQVVKEKARVTKEDEARASTAHAAIDAAVAHAEAELAHVTTDEPVGVIFSLTVHRPDPA